MEAPSLTAVRARRGLVLSVLWGVRIRIPELSAFFHPDPASRRPGFGKSSRRNGFVLWVYGESERFGRDRGPAGAAHEAGGEIVSADLFEVFRWGPVANTKVPRK